MSQQNEINDRLFVAEVFGRVENLNIKPKLEANQVKTTGLTRLVCITLWAKYISEFYQLYQLFLHLHQW